MPAGVTQSLTEQLNSRLSIFKDIFNGIRKLTFPKKMNPFSDLVDSKDEVSAHKHTIISNLNTKFKDARQTIGGPLLLPRLIGAFKNRNLSCLAVDDCTDKAGILDYIVAGFAFASFSVALVPILLLNLLSILPILVYKAGNRLFGNVSDNDKSSAPETRGQKIIFKVSVGVMLVGTVFSALLAIPIAIATCLLKLTLDALSFMLTGAASLVILATHAASQLIAFSKKRNFIKKTTVQPIPKTHEENVLQQQPFIRYSTKTLADLLEERKKSISDLLVEKSEVFIDNKSTGYQVIENDENLQRWKNISWLTVKPIQETNKTQVYRH
jgi:hypothetical protein